MDLQKWAAERVEKLTESGKFHINQGWTLEFTLDHLKKTTTLGTAFWPIVVKNLTDYNNSI